MIRGNAAPLALVATMALLIGACAGGPPFNTPKNYDSYIASLSLERHAVAEAAAILVREGFSCEIRSERQGSYTVCSHPTPRSVAFVSLRPDGKGQTSCVVEHGYWITLT